MTRLKELKTELGSRYEYKRLLSGKEISALQKENPSAFDMQTAAILQAGCVKLEVTLYKQGGQIKAGYDMFVKENPEDSMWINFGSPTDVVSINENEMFFVLDKAVQGNNLSYTECNFEILDGKVIKPEDKTESVDAGIQM